MPERTGTRRRTSCATRCGSACRATESVPLERLIAPACVLDATDLAGAAEPGQSPIFGRDRVLRGSAEHRPIERGDAVLLHTGWTDAHYRTGEAGHLYARRWSTARPPPGPGSTWRRSAFLSSAGWASSGPTRRAPARCRRWSTCTGSGSARTGSLRREPHRPAPGPGAPAHRLVFLPLSWSAGAERRGGPSPSSRARGWAAWRILVVGDSYVPSRGVLGGAGAPERLPRHRVPQIDQSGAFEPASESD